jgi:RNA polymerase sigma-70 factor (ECF subfamily)
MKAELGGIIIGDPQAFEGLFRRYYASLFQYCQGIVTVREVAEDIVQDVFVYLWNNRKTIEITTSIKAYLYSSVRHGALNWLKRQSVEQAYEPEASEFVVYMQETEYSDEELSALESAKRMLNELPERCRAIFLMNRVEGKKYREIAQELNISINTVKSQLLKAYRKFKID